MHRLAFRIGARGGRSAALALLATSATAAVYATSQPRVASLAAEARPQEPHAKWARLPSPGDKTTERTSGAQFSNAIVREEDGEKLMRLCATSVRCMLGMCWLNRARAYAFGIYLGSAAVEDLVAAGKDDLQSINPRPDANDVVGDAPFYPSSQFTATKEGYYFTNGPSGLGYYRDEKSPKWSKQRRTSPMIVRLIMLHDVDGEHLAHGFEKTFKSRITPEMDPTKKCLAQITQFTSLLRKIEKLPKGAQVDLVKSESGVLTLAVEGQVLGHFDALLMGWAAIDAFIGPKGHLGQEGKKELVANAKRIYEIRPLAEFTSE